MIAAMTDQAPGEPHPKIARLVAAWRAMAPAPGVLPGRQHFDPMSVPGLLQNVWLVDVEPGPPRRFRLRLIGGAIVDAGSLIRKGDYMDDPKFSPDPRGVAAVMNAVVETGQPDWRRGPTVLHHAKHVDTLERVILPLATDGHTIDMLLCMTVFYRGDGTVS